MRVVLNIMAGHEPDRIGRAIASALPYVDGVVVQCNAKDPGPTLEAAYQFLEPQFPVLGEVTSWVDFGTNRTRAFQAVARLTRTLGWDPAETYALRLDADQTLEVDGPTLPALDGLEGYALDECHPDGLVVRAKAYLLRADVPWACVGPTHEAWITPPGAWLAQLEGARIHEVGDGQCKADKYERDLALMSRHLATHPGDTRMQFYEAQTLWSIWKRDRTDEARAKAHAANVRVGQGAGWSQERVVAYLRASEMAPDLEGVELYAKRALGLDSTRAEAYIRLCHVAHARKDWRAVVTWAGYALQCQPRPGGLFLERTCYGWQAWDFLALGYLRTGAPELAAGAWTKALACDPAPSGGAAAFMREGLKLAVGEVGA